VIKRVEINYRGIFQKTLAKRIGSDIIIIASRMGRIGFSNGRYSDSPERNGIPCKYFAFVSHDLGEEELEAECGAKLDIDQCDISVVLDDTMCKGVEPWGWHGIRPINEKVQAGGTLLVVSKKDHTELLKFVGNKPYDWKLATYEGDASLAGLWVFKDDLTHERTLGAIAGIDPGVIGIEAVEAYLNWKNPKEPFRAEAARKGYGEVLEKSKPVPAGMGVAWPHQNPVLPKWFEFGEGAVVPAVKRGFELGPRGQQRNPQFQRGTTKTQRPVVRFDLCTKCTLCWAECPDECFDPTTDGLYDIDYAYCVGCGKCAQICPVKECIVMVDELQFENDESPWEAYKRDRGAYTLWAEAKKSRGRYIHPFITGMGLELVTGESVPLDGKRKARGGRNLAKKLGEVTP
jgi:pyruvate ferredoxin oxidoreductase delta subunit